MKYLLIILFIFSGISLQANVGSSNCYDCLLKQYYFWCYDYVKNEKESQVFFDIDSAMQAPPNQVRALILTGVVTDEMTKKIDYIVKFKRLKYLGLFNLSMEIDSILKTVCVSNPVVYPARLAELWKLKQMADSLGEEFSRNMLHLGKVLESMQGIKYFYYQQSDSNLWKGICNQKNLKLLNKNEEYTTTNASIKNPFENYADLSKLRKLREFYFSQPYQHDILPGDIRFKRLKVFKSTLIVTNPKSIENVRVYFMQPQFCAELNDFTHIEKLYANCYLGEINLPHLRHLTYGWRADSSIKTTFLSHSLESINVSSSNTELIEVLEQNLQCKSCRTLTIDWSISNKRRPIEHEFLAQSNLETLMLNNLIPQNDSTIYIPPSIFNITTLNYFYLLFSKLDLVRRKPLIIENIDFVDSIKRRTTLSLAGISFSEELYENIFRNEFIDTLIIDSSTYVALQSSQILPDRHPFLYVVCLNSSRTTLTNSGGGNARKYFLTYEQYYNLICTKSKYYLIDSDYILKYYYGFILD